MGAFLDKPVTEKHTDVVVGTLDNKEIRAVLSTMQGWRVSNEDQEIARIGLDDAKLKDLGFFGVFDGHGGSLVSNYSADNLFRFIQIQPDFEDNPYDAKSLGKSLIDGFLDLDEEMKELGAIKQGQDHSGSTAVVMFLTPKEYIAANCGDSRLIIVDKDGNIKFATLDHKPDSPEERQRIVNAGGHVSMKRVNGDLAVSRALGDFMYKRNANSPASEQQVSPVPIVDAIPRSDDDMFVVIACDGIWDVISNEECAKYVHQQMKLGFTLTQIAEMLIDSCLEKNSRDNMSVVIIALPGAPKEIGTKKPAIAARTSNLEAA